MQQKHNRQLTYFDTILDTVPEISEAIKEAHGSQSNTEVERV